MPFRKKKHHKEGKAISGVFEQANVVFRVKDIFCLYELSFQFRVLFEGARLQGIY